MLEALFGADMPLAVRFFLAFLIVLGLIGATAWAVRRFGAGRLGGAGARGRQPRLAVIDYASVDSRRRLILVRRDNIEHLVLIGGPTDVVVEANIVRAAPAATREAAATRPPPAAETLPRAIPLPENGNGSWPLQPEPMGTPRPGPRLEPDEQHSWPLPQHSEAASPRPARETLAAIADEIASRPVPLPRSRPGPARPRPVEPRAEQRGEPRSESRSEVRMPQMQAGPDPQAVAAADQNLAEMAHRLEAALRKPKAQTEGRTALPPVIAAPPPAPENDVDAAAAEAASRPPRAARPAEERPAPSQAEGRPKEGKALYDSLEQEMASLLGRPAGKI
jgi:flagellar protein FliO/FliZ